MSQPTEPCEWRHVAQSHHTWDGQLYGSLSLPSTVSRTFSRDFTADMHVQRHTVYMHVQPYRMLNTTRSLALPALRHSHPRTPRHLSSTTRRGTTTRTCTLHSACTRNSWPNNSINRRTQSIGWLCERSVWRRRRSKEAGRREIKTTTERATSGLGGVCEKGHRRHGGERQQAPMRWNGAEQLGRQ